MISFPNAKINIGLNILRRRSDGYHDIETMMLPLKGILCDALEIVPSSEFGVRSSGLAVHGDKKNNLCVKAYELLKKDYSLPSITIHLHKAIPMGAGLGGGSADGAFMIKMLNEEFKLKLTEKKMEKYASQLGSDCAFFIQNEPAFAQGRGEQVSSLKSRIPSLKDKYIAVIYPNVHVSTAEAYSTVKPKKPATSLKKLISRPVEKWKNKIHNDFEDSVFPKYPEIKKIKEKLYSMGALYASMSGSGSAVYGIFKSKPEAKKEFPKLQAWEGKIS